MSNKWLRCTMWLNNKNSVSKSSNKNNITNIVNTTIINSNTMATNAAETMAPLTQAIPKKRKRKTLKLG